MTASQKAGGSFVPLLARLVLALAFIPMGWNKVMTSFAPSAEQAVRLQALGVLPKPTARGDSGVSFAAYQEEPATAPAETQPEAKDPPPSKDKSKVEVATPEVRSLHHVTLMLDGAGMSDYAVIGAWTAALTELVGGTLLLVGLFSRIWGLGLAIAMGTAFYLTSLQIFLDTYMFSATPDQSHQILAQLSLFVLAFGVFLTGGGALSLDRAIFRRREPEPFTEAKVEPKPNRPAI